MSLIPTWPILVVGSAFAFFCGFALEHKIKSGEIATLKLGYADTLKKSRDALDIANASALRQERARQVDFAELATNYEKARQNEKALNTSTIAALRNDVVRLRVSTNTRPAGGGQLPAAAAGSCGGDGQTEQTLSPTVAARLAGRFADYNEIVGQLDLCQDIIRAERKNLATQP